MAPRAAYVMDHTHIKLGDREGGSSEQPEAGENAPSAHNSLGRHVFHHRLARRLALAAFLGTRFHVLVIGELLTRLAAPGTRINTGRTDGVRERPALATICAAAEQTAAQS